ncbi:PIR Superfamily Protein [Plasmodium ovale wallikeri]|uniref:PIR Superfamily Protein n=1 Tax=Plasmodium ovale wallikeri TaxID=864142 RepID=A0A1A9AP84_PLAOA|nr:PIR Superfamily Protein [Plasmodium ovale wallikeri]
MIKGIPINILETVGIITYLSSFEGTLSDLNKLMYNFSNKEKDSCSNVKECIALYKENIVPCYFNENTSFCKALIKLGEHYNNYVRHICKSESGDRILYTGLDNHNREISKEKTGKAAKKDEISITTLSLKNKGEAEESRITANGISTLLESKNLTGFSFILMIIPALFSFFKFTPLGSLLHSGVNKYLGLSGNTDEQSQNLLSFNWQGDETAAHNSEYNIPYNLLF